MDFIKFKKEEASLENLSIEELKKKIAELE